MYVYMWGWGLDLIVHKCYSIERTYMYICTCTYTCICIYKYFFYCFKVFPHLDLFLADIYLLNMG